MYVIFYILAILIGALIFYSFLNKNINFYEVVIIALIIGVVAFYGARVLSILEYGGIKSLNIKNILSDDNGLTFYGGYIPVFIFVVYLGFYLYKEEYLLEKYFATFVIVLLAGYSIGRLGCHFSADGCYGLVTFNGYGIRYTWGSCQTLFPVYPTSLYEAGFNVALAIIYCIIFSKKKKQIIFSFFIIFPLSRFFS